jgi:enoyl-[acyl-carrier protein] reductase I
MEEDFMGVLDGKTALIFGVANKYSIAWGIAEALHREGATLGFSYGMEKLERRVRPLAESVKATFIEECDVTDDAALDVTFAKAQEQFGTINILIHSVAYAGREALMGRFVDTAREEFKNTLDISAYSLVAMARRAEPLMPDGGSILAMTYYGSVAVMPNYNVMGVAKAALESSVRYLANDLGPGGIRVNAISAGPIKTLSASGVSGFRKMLSYHETVAPLRGDVTQEDIGNAAVFLSSDWARMITGEIMYVDSGWNIMGMTVPFEELSQDDD